MRPLRLAVEGLRSFRSPAVTIDFTARDHLAVVGDTGAGKSSILEAITYALYGQSTFTAQGNQELMNDTSAHLRVVLRFRVSGETWEVARALRRDGQGRVTPAGAQLRRLGDDDAAVEQFEKVRPVNERIEKLIGLDSDAFLRTVILPQGRFARLLVEDKPTERGRILRQVWRTDDLEEAGALAGDARVKATALRERLEGAASAYPDDPAAHLAQLELSHAAARARAAAATATAQKADTARKDLADAEQARRDAAGTVERLRGLSLDRATERLAQIAARADEIKKEAAAIEQRRTELEQRLARVPDDGDGPSVEDVASALATLSGIIPRVTAATAAADSRRTSAHAAALRHDDAGRASERASIAERKTAQHAEERPPLAAAVEIADNRRMTVGDRYAACEAGEVDLTAARRTLAARRQESEKLTSTLGVVDEEKREHERAAALADEDVDAARRACDEALSAYPGQRQRLSAAREAASRQMQTVENRYADCRDRKQDAREAEAGLATLRSDQSRAAAELEAARAAEHSAGSEQAAADQRLAAARRSETAAAAARDLHPGDECPVCLRDLPDSWNAPEDVGLAAAEQASADAKIAADGARDNVTKLTEKLNGIKQRLGEAAEQSRAVDEKFRSALTALGEAVGRDLHDLPDGAALIGPIDAAARAAAEALTKHEHEHETRIAELTARKAAATDACEAARQVAGESGKRFVEIETRLQGAEQRIGEAEVAVGAAAEKHEAALTALGQAVGQDVHAGLPDRATLLDPFEAAARESKDALAQHDGRHEELRSEWNRLSADAAAAGEKAAGAARLAEEKARTAADGLTLAKDAVHAVPAPYRPALNLPADAAELHAVNTNAVVEQTTAAERRRHVLAERANERNGLGSALAAAAGEKDALLHRRAAEIELPLNDLAHDLDEHRSALGESARDLGLDVNVPEAASSKGSTVPERRIDTLQRMTDTLRQTTENLAQEAAGHAAAAAKKAVAARGRLADIARSLAEDIDLNDVDAVVGAVHRIAEDARFAERAAAKDAEGFAAIVDDLRRLRELLAEIGERERSLRDLDDALKPGAFPKWLTMRRSRSLLVHASRMLGEMSGGKYAFAEPGETDAQWLVLDRDSGQARTPASLSGGEQFIASLSLALGLVEMMARGGGRLESLFLDEGFGSLDRNNLDAAVQALGTVAAGGRMVGVISHVRAVAEQIDHVLSVTRGATGSRAEWLTDRQRRRLSESDAGGEAASALDGLLE